MKLKCPNCGNTTWKALEQVSAATECEIIDLGDDGIEVTMDSHTEFIRDMATSVTVAYTCGDEECGYTTAPDRLDSLKEEPKVQQNFTPDPADAELHTWTPENGLAVGGFLPKDTVIGLNTMHGTDLHFVKKVSGAAPDNPETLAKLRDMGAKLDPSNPPIGKLAGHDLPTPDEVDEETDTEGHKAAAAENLVRAQEMREARDAERQHEQPAVSAIDRFKRVFGG